MLKFAKSVPYIPDPIRSKPLISDHHKELASQEPPFAVPHHCKPWVDGQSLGWTLSYGFFTDITIHGLPNGKIKVDNLDQLAREAQQAKVVDQFARGHFGISSGYTFSTPNGILSLILPTDHAPENLNLVTGVIESDWYPRQIFLVFQSPPEGVSIHLEYQQPIAKVVLVPRHEGISAEPVTSSELEKLNASRDEYLKEEEITSSRWVDADDQPFTNLYKIWSREHRKKDKK